MKIIWCATDGNDTIGDGSKDHPYLTIEKAITVFANGDQIRLKPGTYTPTDSVIISGVEGSIFSEDPQGAYIQPQKTRNHQACVAILSSPRFALYGLCILQAADPAGNLVGIYADVENFLCLTCSVDGFDMTSGGGHGIFATGLLGRVEGCTVKNMTQGGVSLYGIRTIGIDVIDCTVDSLSGNSGCSVIGIDTDGLHTW